ncbi:GGDEF domain-containing protein [Mesorhizobium sp. SB112]|uniref:GGDEF domain-containing protein n=1 Tax=Mesorhizobium sp. SB112 TaxID=3151853 RepID=UPI003267363E
MRPDTVDDVERLLGGRTRDIRLNGELGGLFLERSWRQTAKIIRAWMVWVIILDVLTLVLYAILLPAQTVALMLLPASILPPAAFVAAVAFRKRRSFWLQGVVLTTSMFLILLSVALVGVSAGGEFYERHLTIMLFVAVTAIVIFPVPLPWAGTVAATALSLYLFFQLQNPDIEAGSALAGTLFFASGMAATLVARRTATILAQKTFLLELRDRIRLTDLTEANARLESLARTDPLTGVANRRAMIETLHRFWENDSVPRNGAAMLMCDVDDFKHLNDNLGHAEGDRCLVKIAGIMQSCMRSDLDHVARFGGEEFLVFLPGCDDREACAVAERIRGRVEAALLSNPTSRVAPYVTLSIGVATMRRGNNLMSVEELQRRADAALYLAKKKGRNCVIVEAVSSASDPE